MNRNIIDLTSLKSAINQLETDSNIRWQSIKAKTNHLKDNFFLETDVERYHFDKNDSLTAELIKLGLHLITNPTARNTKQLGVLIRTYFIQTYGKKLKHKLRKLISKLTS